MQQQEPSKKADSVHHPHDMLFKAVFSNPTETAAFLRAYLPTELSAQFDWSTLHLEEGSYVDEELQQSESDLLFTVTFELYFLVKA
ncbi:Rpn family recombination-promoting nuclease/putative transposase [Chloroflexi bacterium TSY]|nr:Rpn family recombination-promoting nuclease/putative transposase [Chloroflexi bacterium TSY]